MAILTAKFSPNEELSISTLEPLIDEWTRYERSGVWTGKSHSAEACLSELERAIISTSPAKAHKLFLEPFVQSEINRIQNLAQKTEAYLEKVYADKFLAVSLNTEIAVSDPSQKARSVAKLFGDYHRTRGYLERMEAELGLLGQISIMAGINRFVFVGSGALPLSAIFTQILTGAMITCVEIDPEAATKGEQVVSKLEAMGVLPESTLQIEKGDAQAFDYRDYHLVFLDASLSNDKKEKIFQLLETNYPDVNIVLVRTTKDLAQLIFPPTFHPSAANRLKFRSELKPSQSDTLLSHQSSPTVKTGPMEILSTTQFYLSRVVYKVVKGSLRSKMGSAHNWSDRSSISPNPRSIGRRQR